MNNRDCVSAERVVKNTTAKIVRHLIPAMFAIWSFVQAVKRSPIAALLSVTEKFAVVASQKIDAESAIEPGVSAVFTTDLVSPQIFIFVLVMRVIYVSVVLETTKSLGPNIVMREMYVRVAVKSEAMKAILEVEDMLCRALILQVLPLAICDSHKICSRKRILQ